MIRRAALAGATVAVVACGGSRPAPPAAATCAGERLITTQRDLDAVGACARWDGDLTIRGGAPLSLAALASLDEVTGSLVVGPTFGLDLVDLGVRRVGGELRIVSNTVATGLFLPQLERAGRLEIAGNVAAGGLSAPRLAEVTGDVVIEDNPSLERIDAPALARVGGTVRLADNPVLEMIEAPALAAQVP